MTPEQEEPEGTMTRELTMISRPGRGGREGGSGVRGSDTAASRLC